MGGVILLLSTSSSLVVVVPELLSRDDDKEEDFLMMDVCNRKESGDKGTTAAVTMDRRDDGVVKASAPLGKIMLMMA